VRLARFIGWLIGRSIIGLRSISSWLDDQNAPVMRERINKGSDRYFIAEIERRAKEEID
jgi:hypothetical protein